MVGLHILVLVFVFNITVFALPYFRVSSFFISSSSFISLICGPFLYDAIPSKVHYSMKYN